eukprot:scaffold1014_cov363-Pavlova_lutheri.AAC.2
MRASCFCSFDSVVGVLEACSSWIWTRGGELCVACLRSSSWAWRSWEGAPPEGGDRDAPVRILGHGILQLMLL